MKRKKNLKEFHLNKLFKRVITEINDNEEKELTFTEIYEEVINSGSFDRISDLFKEFHDIKDGKSVKKDYAYREWRNEVVDTINKLVNKYGKKNMKQVVLSMDKIVRLIVKSSVV